MMLKKCSILLCKNFVGSRDVALPEKTALDGADHIELLPLSTASN